MFHPDMDLDKTIPQKLCSADSLEELECFFSLAEMNLLPLEAYAQAQKGLLFMNEVGSLYTISRITSLSCTKKAFRK